MLPIGNDVSNKMLRKSTSFNLPVELLQELKVGCAIRGTNQTDVVIQGIESFLQAKPLRAVSDKQINPDNQTWHDKLEAVMESDVHTAVDMLQHAVTAAYELMEANRRLRTHYKNRK